MEDKKDEEMMGLMENKPKEKDSSGKDSRGVPKVKDPKANKPLKPINYEYLNGLRGWGAFAVFLFHYTEGFWKMDAHPKD